MNNCMIPIVFVSFLLTSYASQADVLESREKNYWQCTASDHNDKQWVARSEYERGATNKAFEGCKKESSLPTSCKVAKENCEEIVKGVSTRPMWQCTALDQMARPWRSSFYPQRDDAALGAKAYCQHNSKVPDSCYINLLTCKNMNALGRGF